MSINQRPVRDGKTINFQGGIYHSDGFVVGQNVRVFTVNNDISIINWAACDTPDTAIQQAQLITTVDGTSNLHVMDSNTLFSFIGKAFSILKQDIKGEHHGAI